MIKKILVTGACGLIGRAIMQRFSSDYKIIAFDREASNKNCDWGVVINGDITDTRLIQKICNTHMPDIVVHCAGISYQKIIGPLDKKMYNQVNCLATKELANAAVKVNPNVHFIFLSSISVYGEDRTTEVGEDDNCNPTSEYAVTKLNAEKRLKKLYDDKILKKLDILRLSPLYDKKWTVNLDKRVFVPGKIFYFRFGTGHQKMSILSRQNLVDFIDLIMVKNDSGRFCNIFNVCDQFPCTFDEIIRIFKTSKYQPDRKVIQVPLGVIKILTCIASIVFKNKSNWLNASYKKLTNELVFDNQKMLETGFRPKYSLETVFKNEIN